MEKNLFLRLTIQWYVGYSKKLRIIFDQKLKNSKDRWQLEDIYFDLYPSGHGTMMFTKCDPSQNTPQLVRECASLYPDEMQPISEYAAASSRVC